MKKRRIPEQDENEKDDALFSFAQVMKLVCFVLIPVAALVWLVVFLYYDGAELLLSKEESTFLNGGGDHNVKMAGEGPAMYESQKARDAILGLVHSARNRRGDFICHGKQRFLDLLWRAGRHNLTEQDCEELPTWGKVGSLYYNGIDEEPLIHGMDTCAAYREHLREVNQAIQDSDDSQLRRVQPRVSGLFNTGTHALAQLLSLNLGDELQVEQSYREYDMPFGKHRSPTLKWLESLKLRECPADLEEIGSWRNITGNRTTALDCYLQTMPIVIIKDPFRWMKSTCRLPYGAVFGRGLHGRCPALVASPAELTRNLTTIPAETPWLNDYLKAGDDPDALMDHLVAALQQGNGSDLYHVHIESPTNDYESLAHMWSKWNRQWLEYEHPRLMIRFEDLLFRPEQVLNSIRDCVLGEDSEGDTRVFRYQLESLKNTSKASDFIHALGKYRNSGARFKGLSVEELNYLQSTLDPDLMQLFHYPHVHPPTQS